MYLGATKPKAKVPAAPKAQPSKSPYALPAWMPYAVGAVGIVIALTLLLKKGK
jgi:hypothetical protein